LRITVRLGIAQCHRKRLNEKDHRKNDRNSV